jgi:predicted AlkP superfamily phosphohydrolase/phosphomutase/tetratricopeptide (TPR) repeat protein
MTISKPLARKVLLIGWDAADWKVITPLLEAGRMPHLEHLINHGVMGNLATLYPDLSPMLWTSIATGKRPFKHGIYGFTEPDPHSGGIRPITNLSRNTKTIWNILGQLDKKCAVVSWWPSHPAEPINGVMVSNLYQKAVGPKDKPWPMKPGSMHPERLIDNLAQLRRHPGQLKPGHILPFIPKAADIDQKKDRRLVSLSKIIAENLSVEAATSAIMHHEPWDFTAVYFDGIDHFCHAFMQYHPPKLEWVSEEDFELYRGVVEGGYILHDILLGRLLKEAGEDTTIILNSDHGFRSDHLRPRSVPIEPAGPAAQHRHYGVIVMKGPGIKKDERIYGASLLDICPTILTLFGLPVGQDMDGQVLTTAFEIPPEIKSLPSWDAEPGPAGLHPPDKRLDPVEAAEALNQLVALGYIEKPDENREKAVTNCVRELDYNLARTYMDAGRHAEAIPILDLLVEGWPDQHRFGIQLVNCYQALGRVADARKLLEDIFRRKDLLAREAREKLRELNETLKDRKPEEVDQKQLRELRELRGRANFNPFAMEYLMGSLAFSEGNSEQALIHLKRAGQADANQTGLHLKLGAIHLKLKHRDEAEACFQKALSLDPDSAEAYQGLSEVYFAAGENEAAAEAALESVALRFYNPKAHYLLGASLHRLEELPRALEALKVAVSQNPNFPRALRRLAYIYKWHLDDLATAVEYQVLARQAARRLKALKEKKVQLVQTKSAETTALAAAPREPVAPRGKPALVDHGPLDLERTIVIVSGLPRSGTSMMMQMLHAGGLPVLDDGQREADEDNLRGYFEYEPVRRMQKDNSFLADAKGKAVKVVAQLLAHLQPEYRYRVVFMERDMDEVLKSQGEMLERQGKHGASLGNDKLAGVYEVQLARSRALLLERNIPVLYLNYSDCLDRPLDQASRLNDFLGGQLDPKALATAVDPGLRRQVRTRGTQKN